VKTSISNIPVHTVTDIPCIDVINWLSILKGEVT